jgi:hypothetical protein
MNAAGRVPVRVRVLNNAFLRVPILVYDEEGTDTALAYADFNAYAPPPPRPFERAKVRGLSPGDPGWGAKDVSGEGVSSLRLAAVPPTPLGDFDADILAGRLTVGGLRQRLFDAYRPQAGSPLVGAGFAEGVTGGKPPSIGPCEPAGRK